jgi:hypothetical protein
MPRRDNPGAAAEQALNRRPLFGDGRPERREIPRSHEIVIAASASATARFSRAADFH